jgi:hypothetical protein
VALNAGFLLMVDGYGYLGADLGVRVALSGELALLITNALESELWTSGVGVAKPLDGGWQGSVSTLVMSFPPWLWASAREDGWTAGDQAGPLMLHAEAAWRGPPRRKRE